MSDSISTRNSGTILLASFVFLLPSALGQRPQLGVGQAVVTASAMQLGGLALWYLYYRKLSVRFTLSYMTLIAVSWAWAAPAIMSNARHLGVADRLRSCGVEVWCRYSEGNLVRFAPPLAKFGFGRARIYNVTMSRLIADDELDEAFRLLEWVGFDGELTIERDLVTDDNLLEVTQISRLRKLVVRAKGGPTTAGIQSLGTLRRLEELELTRLDERSGRGSSTQLGRVSWNVSDQALSGLASLKRLEISGISIDGSFVNRLENRKELRYLALSHTRFDDHSMRSLAGSQLNALILIDCPISDAAMVDIVRLPNLRSLTIESSLIGDRGALQLRILDPEQISTLDFAASMSTECVRRIKRRFSPSEHQRVSVRRCR